MNPHYTRVIPRDLFNEATLLKCMGKLCIHAENVPGLEVCQLDPEHPRLSHLDYCPGFQIGQDESSGSIAVLNVEVTYNGEIIHCCTPLNARDSWPMLATVDDYGEDVPVFTPAGELHPEFIRLLDTIRPQ